MVLVFWVLEVLTNLLFWVLGAEFGLCAAEFRWKFADFWGFDC